MKTPITYYGGKQCMINDILPLIPEHKIYNEPFFGGGAIFFAKKPAKIEFINDISGEVVNFYKQVKTNFDALHQFIDCTLHSEFQFNEAKEIYKNSTNKTEVERAWAVWMLANQSFLAILGNTWSIDKHKPKSKNIANKKAMFTKDYVARLENTSIFCRDALRVINNTDTAETFHYIDPPYYNADMGHYGGYTKGNFEDLLKTLTKVKGKFLLSSYPSDILSKYVKQMGWKQVFLHKNSSARADRKKIEVLTSNY
jgi:DNA adenine methylase